MYDELDHDNNHGNSRMLERETELITVFNVTMHTDKAANPLQKLMTSRSLQPDDPIRSCWFSLASFGSVRIWLLKPAPVVCVELFHLEELVQVLLQVLDEVGVGQFGQDELFDLLREWHLGLSQPRPVERVYTKQTKRSVMCCCTEELGFVL